MANAYLDALKKKGSNKDVVLHNSPRRQAILDQKNRCAKCGKDLKPMQTKFIKTPEGNFKVICSNCAINIPKR